MATLRATLLLLCTGALYAGDHPDFSGVWKLDPTQSHLGELNLKSAVFHIDHREPEFVVARTLSYASETKNARFNLRTDGRHVVVPYGDTNLDFALRWTDGSLLCSLKENGDADDLADIVEYKLSPDRRVLTIREHGRGEPKIWVLQRQDGNPKRP